MEWLLPLILQIVLPADSLMQVTLNKSLAQVIQEQISCRKEFDEARPDFEQANAIDDPFQRVNAIGKIRRGVYYVAASGHKPNGLIPARFICARLHHYQDCVLHRRNRER